MTEKELKESWKRSADNELVSLDDAHLAQELGTRLKKFERTIKRRNNREIIIALIIMPCLAALAWFIHPLLSKVGAMLLVAFCAAVVIVLKTVQKYKPRNISLPVMEYLLQYRRYLEKERSLLANVAYWYISPAVLGSSLVVIGLHKYLPLIFNVAYGALAYYINRRAVKNYFDPLIAKIAADINSLQANE